MRDGMGAASFQNIEGADDVGTDIRAWIVDGMADTGLRRQMMDLRRTMGRKTAT